MSINKIWLRRHLLPISGLIWTLILTAMMFMTQIDRSNRFFFVFVCLVIPVFFSLIIIVERNSISLCGQDLQIFWFFTILLRLLTFLFPVGLSDDIYRYLWDGHVQQNDINPYQYSPADEQLVDIRTSWWSMINNTTIHTPYPPLSQMVFYLIQQPTDNIQYLILITRIVMTLFDLGVVYLLLKIVQVLKIPSRRVIYYSWSPLTIFEFAGNAHNDVIAIFFMVLTLYILLRYHHNSNWQTLGAVSLALGILAKYFPVILLLFVVYRWKLRDYFVFVFTILLVSVPYYRDSINPLMPEGQTIYFRYFRFNESINRVVYILPGNLVGSQIAMNFYFFIIAIIALFWFIHFLRDEDKPITTIKGITWIFFAILLIGPDVQPWYVLWILPVAILILNPAVITFSLTVLLSYHVYLQYDATGNWAENPIVVILEYLPVYYLIFLQFFSSGNKVNKLLFNKTQ